MSNINYCPKCGSKVTANMKFCTNCGYAVNQYTNERRTVTKRDKVLASSRQKSKKKIFATLFVAIFSITIILFITSSSSVTYQIIEQQPQIGDEVRYSNQNNMYIIVSKVSNGKIIIPLDIVKKKRFVKFNYNGKYSSVPLLAYISEEGKLITAISMCEPCNSTDFHIRGDKLICNSCGTTWEINTLEAISGSCGKYPPDPIPSIIVGDEIQINEEDVARWTRRI